MKGRSKRIIAMLSVAVMLVGQCCTVLAEEVTNSTEVVEASEIGIEEQAVETTSEAATVAEEIAEAVTEEAVTETVVEETAEVATEEVVTETVVEETVEAVTEEAVMETVAEETAETVTEAATETMVEEDLAYVPMLLVEEDLANVPMLLAEESTLLAPTNVKWTEGYTGITYENPNTEEVWLIAVLYSADGSWQTYTSFHTSWGWNWEVETYFAQHMKFETDYYVTLYVMSGELTDGEAVTTCESSEYKASTEKFSYTCPEKIATPSNIKFYTNGVVTWDAVEGASGYNVWLYDVSGGAQDIVMMYNVSENSCSVKYAMEDTDTKTYSVAVQTISGDMTKYSSSDESALVEWEPVPETELQAATDLGWSDETPGMLEFYNPNVQEISIDIRIKNGAEIVGWWGTSAWVPGIVSVDSHWDIEESGDYTYEVKLYPYGEEKDGDFTTGCVSTCTEVYTYVKPDKQLATPTNIKWSETEAGVVTWDAVAGAGDYLVRLYEVTDGAANPVIGYYSSSPTENFVNKMAEGKSYAVKVKALSKNIEEATHSEESELVYLDASAAVDEVNTALSTQVDSLSSDSTKEDVKAAADAVKSEFADSKNNLQYAMQTNDETQSQIEKLEELYEEKLGVTSNKNVAEDTGIDASKVSLLGASLNATQAGEVSFNMSKPDEETQKDLITHSRFNNAICFSMDLEGAGVTPGNLDIPVTVTMPCPEGININKLCIIHYAADGSSEYLDVRQNADGTISFTVTHFSEFVFGEEEETTPDDENTSSDNNNATSNSGAGNATQTSTSSSTKKVKPWVPTTEDEKERYSFLGRDKVNYIVGTEGGYKAELVNMMQGSMFVDAVKAAAADYSIARTYNVKIDGKLTYETAAPAMFVLNIPEEYLAENREYKMVCVSKDGEVIVLDDLDTAAETISFLTNKFYAFALVYKDAVVTE